MLWICLVPVPIQLGNTLFGNAPKPTQLCVWLWFEMFKIDPGVRPESDLRSPGAFQCVFWTVLGHSSVCFEQCWHIPVNVLSTAGALQSVLGQPQCVFWVVLAHSSVCFEQCWGIPVCVLSSAGATPVCVLSSAGAFQWRAPSTSDFWSFPPISEDLPKNVQFTTENRENSFFGHLG